MSITAKELARMLNLSEAAISMALNNKPGVSTATRKRVLEAARAGGYDFSRLAPAEPAASMSGSIYFIIYRKHGAVVADTPFFAEISDGIGEGCRKHHYFLSIQYLYEADLNPALFEEWRRLGCRGIILLATEMQENDMKPFLSCGIPLVLLDNYFENLNIDSVLINNVQGAYLAASYLIQKQKSRPGSFQPGYLHSSYSINNFEERADGFYKAIRRNGMSTSRSVVHRLTPSVEGAYADMLALLEQGETPARSYFADNDLIAAGAIRAFREKGYRIPQDIAVIGFDDMPLCTYIEPPLTTVCVPKHYMGKMAVDRLAELICDPHTSPAKIEIATSLQKRKSC